MLRFNSREVLKESDAVIDVIYRAIVAQLHAEIPPNPPFFKGGKFRLALTPYIQERERWGGNLEKKFLCTTYV